MGLLKAAVSRRPVRSGGQSFDRQQSPSMADDGPPATSVSVVRITAGMGVIPGFARAVADVCRYVGCDAEVSLWPDVAGFADAVERGVEVVLSADDHRFVALHLPSGSCFDNSVATGTAYAVALECAAGGVGGRRVLVFGLGPVGLAAAARLASAGAEVLAVEPDWARADEAMSSFPWLRVIDAEKGLVSCRLVLDASPASDLIDAEWVTSGCVVAGPGVPSGLTAAAARALGPRSIHEPLALGVATMATSASIAAREYDPAAARPRRGGRRGVAAGDAGGPYTREEVM